MKKIFLASWLACLALGVMAQQKTLTITRVEKGEEPKAVMNAIKNDFPGTVSSDLSYLPAKLYGDEWNIQLEGEQLDHLNFYQVNIKEGNTDFTAVYDKNGELLSSKHLIHNAKLPMEVSETLKKFAGWHVDKTHEMIKYKGKSVSDIYKVKLQKGAEHKTVYLDAAGNIIHSRFTVI